MAVSRRGFLLTQAAFGVSLATEGSEDEKAVYRFAAGGYEIQMDVRYFDAYATQGFWFTDRTAHRRFCLSGNGQKNRNC
jgi:hypothetical protein